MTTRRWRLWGCASAALVAVGCRAVEPMPAFDETPAVAVLITPELPPLPQFPLGTPPPPDSGLYATLVTTGTPAESPYLRAERFEMRRVSDGARFAWRPFPTERDVVGFFPEALGNYFLPRRPNAQGLGSDSIAAGVAYDLIVESGAYRITGRTLIPGRVEFTRATTDGDSIVRWHRSAGAAAYVFSGEFSGELWLIADTAAVLRRRTAFPGEPTRREFVRVFALDSNRAALRDFRVSRAGISGGWGFFGSFTWADVELAPRR